MKKPLIKESKRLQELAGINELGGPVPQVSINVEYYGAPANAGEEKLQSCGEKIRQSVDAILKETFGLPFNKISVKVNEYTF